MTPPPGPTPTLLLARAPIRTVSLASVPPVPWRNGGGLTRDLLTAGPCAATGSDCGSESESESESGSGSGPALGTGASWRFRISVAEIARDGPFSAYPGFERWFAVIEGAGVELQFDDALHRLSPQSAPLVFDGAAAPACRLVDGPTLDLNLLVDRSAGRGVMQSARAGSAWASTASIRAVYTAHAAALYVEGHPPLALAGHSLAWMDRNGDRLRWSIETAPMVPLRAWWLDFEPDPS